MPGSEYSGPILPNSSPAAILTPIAISSTRERGLEVVEPLDQLRDEEEQRPQAEQRERVGGEDDERDRA